MSISTGTFETLEVGDICLCVTFTHIDEEARACYDFTAMRGNTLIEEDVTRSGVGEEPDLKLTLASLVSFLSSPGENATEAQKELAGESEALYEGLQNAFLGYHRTSAGFCRISVDDKGYYWQSAIPGCMPEGDPVGPFESATRAYEAWLEEDCDAF